MPSLVGDLVDSPFTTSEPNHITFSLTQTQRTSKGSRGHHDPACPYFFPTLC